MFFCDWVTSTTKEVLGGITNPNVKLYYITIVLKTVWYCSIDRQYDRWNRIVDPEMNPQTYGHLVFDKRTKTIQWIKDSIFIKWCWINWR